MATYTSMSTKAHQRSWHNLSQVLNLTGIGAFAFSAILCATEHFYTGNYFIAAVVFFAIGFCLSGLACSIRLWDDANVTIDQNVTYTFTLITENDITEVSDFSQIKAAMDQVAAKEITGFRLSISPSMSGIFEIVMTPENLVLRKIETRFFHRKKTKEVDWYHIYQRKTYENLLSDIHLLYTKKQVDMGYYTPKYPK